MTEYGRGQGSQPWHPEDPLYGDQGWDGAQRPASSQDPYGVQQQGDPQGYAYDAWQQDQQQPETYTDPYGAYQQPHQPQPYGQSQPGGHEYGGYGAYPDTGQQAAYGAVQEPHLTYGQQHPTGGPDPYQAQGGQSPYGQGAGHYDAGQGAPAPHDPYAASGANPYPHAEQPPPPGSTEYSGRPGEAAASVGRGQDAGDPDTGWDPGPELEDHAFFAEDPGPELVQGARSQGARSRRGRDSRGKLDDRGGRGEEDDEKKDEDAGEDAPPRSRAAARRERGRGRKGAGRRKNGVAGLIVAVVLVGGVVGVGYVAFQYVQGSFGSAPDYSGQGSGEVQVEIPADSSLSQIGNILKKKGVVKSHDAFVEASGKNDEAGKIHAGSYILRKEMSAAAAIEMMLDPASQGGLIVPEGLRASRIYELIDEKTASPKGTTERVAQDGDFDLPSWAEEGEDPLEGFLFPSKYGVTENTKPEAVLREMVKRAKAEFKKVDLEGSAKKVNHTPYEVLTIASLIQAEAQSDDEFGKVSRVVYNRLKPGNTATNGRLDFDSTINYALGRSTLDVSVGDTKLEHPYNTYRNAGLPPGPIDNPGHQAIEAALKPTKGEWLYFVTVRPGDTRFSETFEEHSRHVREFNEEQKKKKGEG